MKVAIGNDHHGLHIKEIVTNKLQQAGIEVLDVGCFSQEPANHIEYGIKVGELVRDGKVSYGLLICGSGIGISIAANKVKGVRCALVADPETAKLTRAHNNANVLAMSKNTSDEVALAIVDNFINSPFLAGKYQERLEVLTNYEKKGQFKK